ncbi:hypothetical protein PWT90_01253 [Aphanocladium album]|nr:hypothetical protein PWT90_01253 [Aphanocladium album]
MRFGVLSIGLVASVVAPCLASLDTRAAANSTLEMLSAVPSCALANAINEAAKNVTETACGAPIRDKSGQYRTMSICLGVLSVFLVLVRICFKLFWSASRSLGPDDKVILGTLVLRISCTIINVEGLAAHGLGRDVWMLPISELVKFVMWLYIMEILYLAELSLLKLSLSAFYLCIFPGTGIRRLLLGTCVLNALFGLVFVIVAIFQCSPIHYWWTQYSENPGTGSCININAMGWANASISVVIDALMIAIPLSQVHKLHLHWKKKMGVIIMFMTGTFVTVVSVLRLRSLVGFANSSNPTWDQWEIAYWSTIEVNIGMICTCLPSLRLLLVRMFPRLLSNNSASGRSVSYAHQTRDQNALQSRTSESTHGNELSDLEQSKQHDWRTDPTQSTKELL